MQSKIPKQFLEIEGRPILLKTIEKFLTLEREVELILVLPKAYIGYWQNYCVSNDLWFKHTIVEGGFTRFHSVRAALKYVPEEAIVAVHDGVRPFVGQTLINKMLDYQFDSNIAGVIPVLPVVDSLRKKSYNSKGEVTSTTGVNREDYIVVQTPQVFDSTRLKEAYSRPYSTLFTDDASVMEAAGYHIDTILGDRGNIKITTPEDLKI